MTVRQFIGNHWATLIGIAALFMWSLSASFVTYINNIPTFEIITLALSISFLLTAVTLTLKGGWHKIMGQPIILWIVGLLGVFGNDVTFIAAFKYAPALHVDLINYLWPIFVMLFSSLLPSERFRWPYLFACLLGFTGIYFVISNNINVSHFNQEYLLGYALALADAMIWAVYTVVARHFRKTPVEMIGMYCGISAIFSLLTHFSYEVTVIPTISQWFIIFLMGLTTQGLAYFFWDIGVKRGDFRFLSILSYFTPVLSVAFLVLLGRAQLDYTTAIGCVLIVSAIFIAGRKTKKSDAVYHQIATT